MVKLPVGVSNFPEMMEEDNIYIDKTKHIFNLIDR
jgi:hypothetical protein